MTLPLSSARRAELFAAYGADPARWPAPDRAAFEAAPTETTDELQRREAASLDAALDALRVPVPPASLRRDILLAVANEPQRRSALRATAAALALLWRELGGVRLAGPALAMALAGGLGLAWLLDPVASLDTVAEEAEAEADDELLALAQLDDTYPELNP